MKRLLPCLLLLASAGATTGRAALPINVGFTGPKAAHTWTLAELNPELPADWTPFGFLVLEFRASFSQRFDLALETPKGRLTKRIGPFAGVWVRAAVPLRFYREPPGNAVDLAATYNQPRSSYWINIGGRIGPLDQVRGLTVALDQPVANATLEIRSIRLAQEDPGDTVLEGKPLVDEFGQYTRLEWPGKVHSLEELRAAWKREQSALAAPAAGDGGRCEQGGFLNTSAPATGFFRVEQIDGRWWFVCPDGHLFFSAGVNGVGTSASTRVRGREDLFARLPPAGLQPDAAPSARSSGVMGGSFYTWNLQRRFGDDWRPAWADLTARRMSAWGFNSIHYWQPRPSLTPEPRVPYAQMLRGWQAPNSIMGMPDVYADDFPRRVDEIAAAQLGPRREDRLMLGYFIGNEPSWPGRESQFVDTVLAGPAGEIQRRLRAYLRDGDTPERRKAFVYAAFARYIEVINAACRRHAPNHLNLGIRFGGNPHEEILKPLRGCDVFSINIYRPAPPRATLDRIYELVQRPILIGEFHIGVSERGLSSGLVHAAGAAERAAAYRHYVEQAAAHPAVVGTHWFQWLDQPVTGRSDGENYAIGLIDVTDQPHVELVAAARVTHGRLLEVHRGTTPPFDRSARPASGNAPAAGPAIPARATTAPAGAAGAIAPKPLFRDPQYDGAADPVVIWNPHLQRWWMFYTNRRANVPGLSGVAWVHGTRIGIAESADGGTTWTAAGEAAIDLPTGFGGAQTTHWAPEVITANDGTHHMFLTVVPGVFENWQHPRSIVHLTSPDLRRWDYVSTLKLGSDRVIDACVSPLPGGGWRMWYNNERDGKSISFADSRDLRTWRDRGKVASLDVRGEGPAVFDWRGWHWMVVDTWKGLAVFRSLDLDHWTRQPALLLDRPGKGADDGVNGGHAHVVVSGGRAFCFYFTHPGRAGTISPQDPGSVAHRRSSIQVVELFERDGWLTADRDAPTRVRLEPPARRRGAAAEAGELPRSPAEEAALRAAGSRAIRAHDPSTPVYSDGEYWIYGTGPGLASWRSKDLLSWTAGPRVFESAPAWVATTVPDNRNASFWAPDIIRVGDRYLLYYSVSAFGKRTSAIALATNTTLNPENAAYRWKDEGVVVESGTADNYNAIDPALLLDRDGKLWMSFGSYWSGLKLVELDPATGLRAPGAPLHAIAHHRSIEAVFIHRHGGHYYLFYNSGYCCRGINSTYHMRVGRAEKITGPYVDREGRPLLQGGGTHLLASEGPFIGPGHPGIIAVDGREWLSCHFYDGTQAGRPTFALRPLTWDPEGWPVVGKVEPGANR